MGLAAPQTWRAFIPWALAAATLLAVSRHWHSSGAGASTAALSHRRLLLETPSVLALPGLTMLRLVRPNPLSSWEQIQVDQHLQAHYDDVVPSGHEHSIVFSCSHPAERVADLCPRAYRLIISGPATLSPDFAQSSEQLDERRVRVRFTIRDPGQYEVWAWPEHDNCDDFQKAGTLYNKMVVRDSPLPLIVTGQPQHEPSELCHPNEVNHGLEGRWLSKAHVNPEHLAIESPHFSWLASQLQPTSNTPGTTIYNHFWAPYQCKIPHRTFADWLNTIKADSIVFFGDSVIRDTFCLVVWTELFGKPEAGQTCHYNSDTGPTGYHTTNKEGTYQRSDGGTTKLYFFWTPDGKGDAVASALESLPHPPTHVLFSSALWLATHPPEQYVRDLTPAMEALERLAPRAKTFVRGSAGVVQAIQCYDRIGGQRFQLEANNAALQNAIATSHPTLRYFDAYDTLNSHPASSSDGRHWGTVGLLVHERPQLGAGEYALLDRLFYAWS
ncbi:hypothetical protein JCM10207_007045 [Rhodosporidiobolus poonsookiae]